MVKLQNSENKKKTKKVVLLVGVIIIVIIGILQRMIRKKSLPQRQMHMKLLNLERIPWMLVRFRDIQPK